MTEKRQNDIIIYNDQICEAERKAEEVLGCGQNQKCMTLSSVLPNPTTGF